MYRTYIPFLISFYIHKYFYQFITLLHCVILKNILRYHSTVVNMYYWKVYFIPYSLRLIYTVNYKLYDHENKYFFTLKIKRSALRNKILSHLLNKISLTAKAYHSKNNISITEDSPFIFILR